MAILKNLLVSGGASRFLGTSYFQDVSIGGTASLASLSLSGNLSVGGTLGVTGEATFSNVAVFSKVGQSTATWNNPALVVGGTADQKHLELCNDTIQGKNNKNTTNNLYLNYYGSNVYLAGSKIYAIRDSTFVAPTANIVTVNAQNVNVTNNLRANHYDLQTVAQLGGSFYVSPTLKFPNSGTTLTVEKSDSTLTLTITDSSITSTTMAGIVWAANSRVKVSGTINGVVTGTMDGTVSSINTSSHVLTLSVSGENSASVVAGSYTASQFSDLTVMIYQRRDGSNDYRVGIWMNCYDIANSSSTIRIYGGSDTNPNVMLGNLTSAGLGTVNNLTPTGWGLFAQNAFLHGKVVANGGFIGNWTIGTTGMYYNSDAPSSTSITMIPGGTAASTTSIGGSSGSKSWIFTGKNLFGIDTAGKLYASSAEISGKITANTGYIGGTSGWTIASQQLSNGTLGADNSLYLGTKNLGSNTSIGGRSGSDWRLTVGSNFGVTNTGAIYAATGKIGGWTINANSIYAGTWGTNGGALVCTGSGTSKSIGGSASISGWVFTAGANFGVTTAGALYASSAHITGEVTATSGAIGGFDITATAIKTKDVAVTSNANNSISLSSVDFTRTINSTSRAGLRFAIGDKFGVTGDGAIYASSATISGSITATSGSIGKFNITTSYIDTYQDLNNKTSATNAGFGANQAFWAGNNSSNSAPFRVSYSGDLVATSATISGTLNAGANSTIGPWTVSTTSIYKGSATFGSNTSGAAYFGNDGLSIAGLLKINANNGTLSLGPSSQNIAISSSGISLGNSESSNIDISPSGIIINQGDTPMATFNSDGIEMRGSAGQILLDINTTGNAVTSTESFGTQINGPFTSGQKETYDMNNYKDRFSNFNGNGTITITITDAENLTDGFPTRTTETYTKSFTSDFSISCLSGKATLSYSHSGKTFTLTFNSNFGSVLYIVETMIQWNYTQYPYNYTFGTRGVNSDIGIGSATIGNNLINTNDNALVVGQYNADDNYLFAVGNGDNDSNRSNAFTVDNYGVVGFSGVAMFGDPSSTFYVTSHTVVNNASVASQSYKDGTITIEKSGYYPLCVAGYNSNTRYLTPTRFYLSNQQSGSGQLNYMIFNPTSSARTGTCTMWVMWVKTT